MKNYNKLHRCSNHVRKQFKREKMVSNSVDNFKLLFMASHLRFLYTFAGQGRKLIIGF